MANWTLNPEVILTSLEDGGAVLLDLSSKRYYTLNPTGGHIWRFLQQGCPEAELGERLAALYATTAAEAQVAALELLAELAQAQLIHADA